MDLAADALRSLLFKLVDLVLDPLVLSLVLLLVEVCLLGFRGCWIDMSVGFRV